MNTRASGSAVGEADDADAGALSDDAAFHLLQNSRRRGVLRYVRERPDADSFDMREITEQVAAWEQGKPVETITSTERQRVYIALYQSHLPKLDDHGVIEYEQSRGTVRATPRAESVGRYLDVDDRIAAGGDADADTDARDDADEATRYFGGATAVSAVLTAAAWVGLVPTLLASSVGAIVTSLFAAVTLGIGLRQRPL